MARVNPQVKARQMVLEYVQENNDSDEAMVLELDDVQIVWFCYILGNWKAMVITTMDDQLYYEVTRDSAKGSIYVDVYDKVVNKEYTDTGLEMTR